MGIRHVSVAATLVVAIGVTLAPRLRAQLPRSTTPPGSGGAMPAGTPMLRRFPYAGVWSGSRIMDDGPGSEAAEPIGLMFDVADTAKQTYSGALLFPDGGRAPFHDATLNQSKLVWEQPNSGGGKWVYSARLVGRDSIAGTVVLRGAPWKPAKDPSGTFGLVRRPAASR
jgi:hypothetical protein